MIKPRKTDNSNDRSHNSHNRYSTVTLSDVSIKYYDSPFILSGAVINVSTY